MSTRKEEFAKRLIAKMGADPAALVHPLFFTPKKVLVSVLQTEEVISLIHSEEDFGLAPGDAPTWNEIPEHLQNRDIFIIDSIYSGTGRDPKRDVYQQVLEPLFNELAIKFTYLKSESATSIAQYAGGFSSERKPLVIFISGDTSISEFVNALGEAKGGKDNSLTFFNIPAGTGNSLSLSSGTYSLADSVKHLLFPQKIVPFNLYEANFPAGSYFTSLDVKTEEITKPLKFLVVLSWGFHASLVADSDTPEMRKHGVKRFQIAAGQNLANEQKYDGVTNLNDKKKIEGPYAYWVLTPATRFEKTFEISPKGDITNDSLYLIAFNTIPNNSEYIIDIMKKVYDKGKHIEDERVFYESISNGEEVALKISADAPEDRRRFCLDGSILKVPEGQVEIKVKGGSNEHNGWILQLIT